MPVLFSRLNLLALPLRQHNPEFANRVLNRYNANLSVEPLRISHRTSLLLIRTLWLSAWLLVVCRSIWSNLPVTSLCSCFLQGDLVRTPEPSK